VDEAKAPNPQAPQAAEGRTEAWPEGASNSQEPTRPNWIGVFQDAAIEAGEEVIKAARKLGWAHACLWPGRRWRRIHRARHFAAGFIAGANWARKHELKGPDDAG
jgi:hypothetical protein